MKYLAKFIKEIGNVVKYFEDLSCRYYYAHLNNTFIERSKFVASEDEVTKMRNLPSNTDSSTKEQANTIWNIYKFTKVIFLLCCSGKIPGGPQTQYLKEPSQKNRSFNIPT